MSRDKFRGRRRRLNGLLAMLVRGDGYRHDGFTVLGPRPTRREWRRMVRAGLIVEWRAPSWNPMGNAADERGRRRNRTHAALTPAALALLSAVAVETGRRWHGNTMRLR